MENQTQSTRALLACGVVSGPLYVMVTLAQALTREGFDLKHHRFSWLTSGELGWIHQANMLMVGAMTVLLAIGVRRVLRVGRGALWGPRLLGMVGVAYVVGGLLRADPTVGFPPGTTPEMAHATWQGAVQNASRGVSTLLLIAANALIARWFAAEGSRAWAWFYATAFFSVFAAVTAVASVTIGGNPAGMAFLATPWICVTTLAVHLRRRTATRHPGVSALQTSPHGN